MSDGISVKIGADISELERKAGQIPDVIDRAARKGKSRRFGDFTEGYYDVGPDRIRSAGRLPSMERSAYEMGQDRAAQEAQDKKFKSELKWNSAIQSDADKAAAQQAAAAEKQQAKEEQQTEAWHRAELARKLKEQKDLAAAEEKRQKEEEARKEKERKLSNADYLKRLKWNSKLLEDENKRAEEAAKAAEWGTQFGKALESRLMGAIGPAAIAMKVIELGWGSVIERVKTLYAIGEAKLESGIQFSSTRGLIAFSQVGTATEEEAIAMAVQAQQQANKAASGGPGANTFGLQYFEMTDYQRYRAEGLDMIELIIAMSKKYKQEGGSPQFQAAAENVLGSNWTKLSALLYMQSNPDKARQALWGYSPGTWKGGAMESIEGAGPFSFQQSAVAKTLKFAAMTAKQGELMGGLSGQPKQLLSAVTSLQAMGGGDILSAIARGPQDRIATATEQTAQNTAVLAGQMKFPSGAWSPTPKTTLQKH